MFGILQDVRLAVRQLRRSPGFTIAAVSMLALGICANSTILSWINSTLLHPIPAAEHTSNLVSLLRGEQVQSPSPPFSYPDYRDLRAANHSFSGILAYHDDWLSLTGGDAPVRVYGANASANYFDVLAIRPYLGRFFLPSDESVDSAAPFAVLGYALWKTHFAGDPAILGKSIEIDKRPLTVIGVAPEGFIGCKTGIRTDLWLPLFPVQAPRPSDWGMNRQDTWLNVTGRLLPAVDRSQATQDLELQMRRLVAAYPEQHKAGNTISLYPLWRSPFGANVYLAASLPILLSIAGVVLLLTRANIATLLLVRFVSRRREIAIRQSLGASRVQLMRQMMLEGLLLSLGGGLVAILLTFWSSRAMAGFIPPNSSPIALNGSLDCSVTAAILVLAVLASLVCAAMPAWRSSHVSTAEVLKEEAGSIASGSSNRFLLSGLVVSQIALSLTLLITAGLFLRTLRKTSEADPGFDPSHVLLGSVDLPSMGYTPSEARAFDIKLLARLETIPGVTSVALADWVPLSLTRGSVNAFPEGYAPALHESTEVRRASVTADYFQTMRIPIEQGRAFTPGDKEDAPRVAIVDRTLAGRFGPGQSPLGKRLRIFDTWYTIVGVARNTAHNRKNEAPEPMIYLSFLQAAMPQTILHLRTGGDPRQVTYLLAHTVHELDPNLPLFDVRTLEESIRLVNMFEVIETTFAGAFAILALILAASGIYGVVAYRTQLRTHEIGIRMALGASSADVLRLILRQGFKLAALGLSLGLILSVLLTRFLRGLLFGVSPTDPLTLLSVSALLALIAVAACLLPALKAMRTNPVNAIRGA